MTAVEVRDDADGTDDLIERVVHRLHGQDVNLRGEEWRALMSTPHSLTLRQWVGDENDGPTGPTVRVTFTVHVEEIP